MTVLLAWPRSRIPRLIISLAKLQSIFTHLAANSQLTQEFEVTMHAVAAASSRFVASESRCAVARRNSLLGSGGLRLVSWRGQRPGSVGLRREMKNRGFASPGVRCKVMEVDEANFEREVLRSETPVLVDFWASWCGPCKLVATSMDVVDKKFAGKLKVVKVETDPNPTLVQMYQVKGLPTLIMFRDGEVVDGGRYEGAISLGKIESLLTTALPSLAAA